MISFDKTRFRFRKDGDLRLVSHHDLMRAFERMLRRADLPFRSTEGFHPQPRLIFALSLPLGIVGLDEVVEIEWTQTVEPEEARARLNDKAPRGLTLLAAKRIDLKQSARPRRAVYRLPIASAQVPEIALRCEAALASTELWVDRERPRPRQVNIRPYVKGISCAHPQEPAAQSRDDASPVACAAGSHVSYLEMDLWITQEGSARADEMARSLGLNDLLDAGVAIERATLEIADEIDPLSADPGPFLPGKDDRARYERPATLKQPMPEAAGAHWGASPSGPIVE